MSRVSAWRAARGTGRLASGGVRLVVDAVVIAGPWLYLPALAGVLAWLAGFPWWIGTGAALVLALFALADGKDGPSLERFIREGQHRVEEARARAKARHVRREWPRLCERAGWITPADLEKRRPAPSLRFARTMGRRLIVAWRPPESIAPGKYGEHVEELRRVVGAHSADWRPVTADPGTVIGLFGLQELPEMAQIAPGGLITGEVAALEGVSNPAPGPVVGQMPDPSPGPASSAVQQAFRFVLGVGTAGEVTWSPFDAAHMLVTGTTGGGKGSVTRTLVAQALASPRWDVTVIDGKQGGEYGWAEDHGAELSRRGPMFAVDVLGDLEAELNELGALLYAEGVERWQDSERAEEWQLRLVVIDELADLVTIRKDGDKDADAARLACATRLNRLVAQGRAVGIHCVLALQRADATIVSGFMRNNLAARIAVGHLDDAGADMMFGAGKDAALAYLDGTPGRAVAVGLTRGHVNPAPLQVHYLRAVDLRPSVGLVAS